MSAPPKKPATYQDIVDLPEHQVGELVDGELYVSPRPASRHAKTSSVLGMVLGTPFQLGQGGPGGWWLMDEPELHLGHDVLVPDLAGWRQERMPHIPDVTYFELAPDWVCELLSPSTMKLDMERKLPEYARAAVKHAWVINPRDRVLHVYRQEREKWLLVSAFVGEGRVRAEPFEDVELNLGALWLDAPARSEP
jgi:Uma2 family endonuclease